MMHFLIVVHVLVTAALIGVVLIQRSETDGFGLGSGSNANLLSGRSTANFLTRTTAILAALFIGLSLLLSVMAAHGSKNSIVDTIEQQEGDISPAPAIGVGKDEDTDATEIGLDRDQAVDTNALAKEASGKKAAAASKKVPATDVKEENDEPAVPAAK